jgi:hypothetical protein
MGNQTTWHHQAPTSESLSNTTSTTFEFRAHGLLDIHSHLLVFDCNSKLEKVKGSSASTTLPQFIVNFLVKTCKLEVLRYA